MAQQLIPGVNLPEANLGVNLPSLPDLPAVPDIANIPVNIPSLGDIFEAVGAKEFFDIGNRIKNLPNEVAASLKPKPVAAVLGEIAGLRLDLLQSHNLRLESEITTLPVEDGSIISQNQVFSPKVYVLKAKIGEVFIRAPEPDPGLFSFLPDSLPVPTDFRTPELETLFPPITLQEITYPYLGFDFDLEAWLKSLEDFEPPDITEAFPDQIDFTGLKYPDTIVTRRETILKAIYTFFRQGIPFGINTPWGREENLLIKSITVDETDGEWASDITITLHEVQVAKTLLSDFNAGQLAGRAGEDTVDQGNQTDKADSSSLAKVFNISGA